MSINTDRRQKETSFRPVFNRDYLQVALDINRDIRLKNDLSYCRLAVQSETIRCIGWIELKLVRDTKDVAIVSNIFQGHVQLGLNLLFLLFFLYFKVKNLLLKLRYFSFFFSLALGFGQSWRFFIYRDSKLFRAFPVAYGLDYATEAGVYDFLGFRTCKVAASESCNLLFSFFRLVN